MGYCRQHYDKYWFRSDFAQYCVCQYPPTSTKMCISIARARCCISVPPTSCRAAMRRRRRIRPRDLLSSMEKRPPLRWKEWPMISKRLIFVHICLCSLGNQRVNLSMPTATNFSVSAWPAMLYIRHGFEPHLVSTHTLGQEKVPWQERHGSGCVELHDV